MALSEVVRDGLGNIILHAQELPLKVSEVQAQLADAQAKIVTLTSNVVSADTAMSTLIGSMTELTTPSAAIVLPAADLPTNAVISLLTQVAAGQNQTNTKVNAIIDILIKFKNVFVTHKQLTP